MNHIFRSVLRHIVSHEGVAVEPSKVTSIQEWPLPKNIKQLHGFLGLAGYYRRFVARYASLAAPLTHLLRKDAFIRTNAATVAFNNSKVALTNTPVLALPDFSKPFPIQTNASRSGVGAVLSQDGHLIAYFSKQMSHRLQQASTYVREMYAITKAMKPVTKPICTLLDALRQFLKHDSECITLIQAIGACPTDHPHHSIRDGLIFYKNRIFIPDNSVLQPIVLAEYHSSPAGGHAGMQRTLARISSTFYWPKMKDTIRDYVFQCRICQETKPFNKAPQGLLQPLQISRQIWDCILMDFITHLPLCSGKATVLVAVDHVIKLHGFPSSIVSDRDPVFMSSFWKELFKLQEDYLRCFTAHNPRTWLQYLPWAERSYNTSWHSSIKMTPFEAVYGRPLPTLKDYIAGTSKIDAVDDLLHNRTKLISQLQANIQRAQLRMCNQTNAHCSDVHFQVDDWVFVKLQPYCQSSVALHETPSEATWEHLDAFRKDFPTFHLEDKVLSETKGNDANPLPNEPDLSKVVERRSTRKTRKPTKLNKF
ncbi:ty3-gypsy retrotransposon protein, partial [Tanacetum coccineum]